MLTAVHMGLPLPQIMLTAIHTKLLLPLSLTAVHTEFPLLLSLTAVHTEFPLPLSLTAVHTEFPLPLSLTAVHTEFPLTLAIMVMPTAVCTRTMAIVYCIYVSENKHAFGNAGILTGILGVARDAIIAIIVLLAVGVALIGIFWLL